MDVYHNLLKCASGDEVYSGVSDILQNGRNIINFFVCSSYEDFEIERRIMASSLFPKLRDICFEKYGVEIKLIDINLGLDAVDELTYQYQQLFETHLHKYAICNIGNCPIILFGNKYGQPIIPTRIPQTAYNIFRSSIRRYKHQFIIDYQSLDVYYKLDSTNLDKEMVLISIKDFAPDFHNKNKNEKHKCREEWKEIKIILKEVFQKLYEICLKDRLLDQRVLDKLFVFELESSVENVISSCTNSYDNTNLYPQQPIVLQRDIIDVGNFIGLSNESDQLWRRNILSQFIDTQLSNPANNNEDDSSTAGQTISINHNSQNLLQNLKLEVADIFGETSRLMKILWRDKTGISEMDHARYLDEFQAYMTSKVLEAVERRHKHLLCSIPQVPELLTHLDEICNARCHIDKLHRLFWGYEEIVGAILSYVGDIQGPNSPLVLYGPPDSGKAIAIAKSCFEIISANDSYNNIKTIIRFISKSKKTTLQQTLQSIFFQLSSVLFPPGQFQTLLNKSKDISLDSLESLLRIATTFESIAHHQILIVLHDVNYLLLPPLGNNAPQTVTIEQLIPAILPHNVKLIVTTTEPWSTRKQDFLNLIIPEFSPIEYNNLLQIQAKKSRRVLSALIDKNTVIPVVVQIPKSILSANLLSDIILKYSDSPDTFLTLTCNATDTDLVNLILKQLAGIYSECVIMHCIAFLYYSNSGLTDMEIVELLSLDTHVMRDLDDNFPNSTVYFNGNIRFPMALWMKIKLDLFVLLVDKMLDGYSLVNLVDKSLFNETIQLYYHDNEDKQFAEILSDYYSGNLSGMTLEYSHRSLPLNPQLKQQKIFEKLSIETGQCYFYNCRKFREYVIHLLRAQRTDELLREVIFNFDWLFNKIKALGVNHLLDDFVNSRSLGKEIILLEESIRNSAGVIDRDLNCLAGELIGQLLPYVSQYPNLKFLIENCDLVAPKHNCFIPIYPSDKLPGSALTSTICCPSSIESALIINNELLLKLKDDSHAYFYDLNQGDITSEMMLSHGSIVMGSNPELVVVLESKSQQVLKIHSLNNGNLLGQIIPMNWIVARPFEERHKYRIHNVDVGKNKMAMLVTNEISYLFLVSLTNFQMLLVFSPGMKLQMLKLSLDETTVFTHKGERLISLNVANNELISAVELLGLPISMVFFNNKEKRAFVLCEKQKSVVVVELEKKIFVNKCYKISFDNCFDGDEDDYVLEATPSSLDNPYLLVRSKYSVLLYNWKLEKILCHVTRPSQLPIYFKLPNQHEDQPCNLQFNCAKLIMSDRAIACALFRDIIICGVADNKVLVTLHAPVGGIVTDILTEAQQFIIGRVDHNPSKAEIMIWRSDSSSLFSRLETSQDKLTCRVNSIKTAPDIAIATAVNSDEMGVFDISCGTLVDLYSHVSNVTDNVLSQSGKWALVSIDIQHNSNILWSLELRKIILEFGSGKTTKYILPLCSNEGFLVVSDFSKSIEQPKISLNLLNCNEQLKESSNEQDKLQYLMELNIPELGFPVNSPLIINGDKTFLFLSQYYIDKETSQIDLLIWKRENNREITGQTLIVGRTQLSEQINYEICQLLAIQKTRKHESYCAVLFEDFSSNLCFLLLDTDNLIVQQYAVIYHFNDIYSEFRQVVISDYCNYSFNKITLDVIDLNTGQITGSLKDKSEEEEIVKFECFALEDNVLISSHNNSYQLMAWRLPELTKIGTIQLKEQLTTFTKCSDDFTLILGLNDGALLAYAIIDLYGNNSESLGHANVKRKFQDSDSTGLVKVNATENEQETEQFLFQKFIGVNATGNNENNKATVDSSSNNSDLYNTLTKRPFSDPEINFNRRQLSV